MKQALIIHDALSTRIIAETILEDEQYQTRSANNGLDAISEITEQLSKGLHFDIILIDMSMPIIDGYKTLSHIKTIMDKSRLSRVKTSIIALTSDSSKSEYQKLSAAGFTHILNKPLKYAQLFEAINPARPFKKQPFNLKSIQAALSQDEISEYLDYHIVKELHKTSNHCQLKDIEQTFWSDIKLNCQIIKAALPGVINKQSASLEIFHKTLNAITGSSASIGLSKVSKIALKLQNTDHSHVTALLKTLFKALLISQPVLHKALYACKP